MELEKQVKNWQSVAELADEVEEGHIEYEKQLQDDVDNKNREIQELQIEMKNQNAKIADLNKTVSNFRNLVSEIQLGKEVGRPFLWLSIWLPFSEKITYRAKRWMGEPLLQIRAVPMTR